MAIYVDDPMPFHNYCHMLEAFHSLGAIEEKLLAKREVDLVTGCWNWTGATNSKKAPYGEIRINNSLKRVTRIAAAIWMGFDLSSGLLICHHCDNTLCFNPEHLYIGTHLQNSEDRVNRGRSPYGDKSNRTHLTPDDVLEMKKLHACGMGVNAVARKFNLSSGAASRILRGERWPHL